MHNVVVLFLHLYIQWRSGTWVFLHVTAETSSSWLKNTLFPGSSFEMPLEMMLLEIQAHVVNLILMKLAKNVSEILSTQISLVLSDFKLKDSTCAPCRA